MIFINRNGAAANESKQKKPEKYFYKIAKITHKDTHKTINKTPIIAPKTITSSISLIFSFSLEVSRPTGEH
jgi:hypothetical protein